MPVWFEAGRKDIFKLLTPDLCFKRWRVALVNMNLDYVAQTRFQEDVLVKTWIEKIGNKSFVVYEELHQGDRLCAKGTATYVYFNYESQSAETIPEAARVGLSKHLKI